jgi:hypothetical protein
MKLDIRLEDGKPAIFWVDHPDAKNSHMVLCFTASDSHTYASRAYLRSLPIPLTREELQSSARLLRQFGALYSSE